MTRIKLAFNLLDTCFLFTGLQVYDPNPGEEFRGEGNV